MLHHVDPPVIPAGAPVPTTVTEPEVETPQQPTEVAEATAAPAAPSAQAAPPPPPGPAGAGPPPPPPPAPTKTQVSNSTGASSLASMIANKRDSLQATDTKPKAANKFAPKAGGGNMMADLQNKLKRRNEDHVE
jgi:hypothetical protein